ncbi:hypothetical protein CH294_18405 [Rhodococcus sp. 14-2483-1-1]|uniref:hypothetical protein n=1 Tax=unclassified Rhodococcus (in: high G+C Gram-positive bacteria) TaxID=192944 RepID=UPI000B9A4FCE|nr:MULTISPECIES: hypothetical protein [unclassified Rhodococcus (in: high G+C Gram-positive bacteria)]OZC45584.1 hypothetical protein CH286_17970 [Rhodococcus sp. WWJCD1]OZF33093.1 hypothetical protein CH294_18405 [Rhodococcus sp. 14-2483-1-1]
MGSKRPANRGQKRAEKTKARQRRHQQSRPAPSGVDSERIADLIDGFVEWLDESEMSEQSEAISRLVSSTLTQLSGARQGFSPSAWMPADAHLLVDAAERILQEESDTAEDTAVNLVLTSLQYLTFLDETDLWDGTPEDYAHCMEDLSDFLEGDEPDMLDADDIDLPDVSLAQELAAISALPLLPALDDIVARVADGLAVSDDAHLQRAVGAAPFDPTEVGAGVATVDYWSTAIATELIRIDGDTARPGDNAHSLAVRGAETVHELVAEHVRVQLSGDADDPDVSRSLANTFAVQTLLAAMTEELPVNNEGEDYADLEGEDLRTAQLIDHRVRSLIEQGILVRIEEVLAVPHALRPAVLDGVAEAQPFGALDDDSLDDPLTRSPEDSASS